jgi:flagellar biosynthesis protein
MSTTRNRAIALRYNQATESSPRVVAKGEGHIAEKILALARDNHIPIRQDSDLIELLGHIELNQEIPPELYAAVAEILSWIYRANSTLKGACAQ